MLSHEDTHQKEYKSINMTSLNSLNMMDVMKVKMIIFKYKNVADIGGETHNVVFRIPLRPIGFKHACFKNEIVSINGECF